VPFTWFVTANRANVTLPDGTEWNYAEERFPATQGPQPELSAQPAAGEAAVPEAPASRRTGPFKSMR
jgi:hypothetical protein